ncbi:MULTISPECIES: COX15/CtaA family protein [unclassified Roseitalea]|uniref:COX15/CtaA family protein n=1 Tax=unclassified Roseitalea TaxID=2639107 RepID=UPI00273D8C86|nr:MULTISPECIES: COX15/CtaA family protein [unclassified Roseitalea]
MAPSRPPARAGARTELRNRAKVRVWLYLTALVLLVLVIVGGATRLTDSGLSITEWAPIHGVIPPLTEAQWQAELEKYRQIPEYQLVNKGMSMAQFQFIYWWEWGHRFLARALGLVFALPLALFWLAGRLDARIRLPLVGLLALGGLQGFIGWWMVSSGLTERVDVSHYRLAVHLCMAALILGGLVWVARSIAPHAADLRPAARSHVWAGALAGLVFLQIYLGALVAGLDAGWVFNQWPMMGEGLFPAVMWEPALGWRNWVENPAMVQFAHRIGAYALLVAVLIHAWHCRRWAPGSTHARRAMVLAALVAAQALVGIVTLIMVVPLSWALVHQGLAFFVLAFAVAHWRAMIGPLPLSDGRPHRHA